MSYEGEMLKKMAMPSKQEVEKELLKTLFRHNGTVKEFSTGEEIVNEIADIFSLSEEQRIVPLERVYKKENRIVKTPLWHRLLYRAADSLSNGNLIIKPSVTQKLTNKKEWMLTENGFDKALELLNIPIEEKDNLLIKSYEVEKEVKKITTKAAPVDYNPIGTKKKITVTREANLRSRGFRQAVIENYDYKCCVCGLKIKSPNFQFWEVEAAHIVSHTKNGKDDIWNGLALCHLHHWAFDVGWFSLTDDYKIIISSVSKKVPIDFGKMGNFSFFENGLVENKNILLPQNSSLFPHKKSIEWHRNNTFYK
ncbi:MAG: HNH endonuclease [Flavobacteriaceae bacterium]|jgi:hypothetical protein|nr:HNH endonuclease [Flavobacteriaceae bacterium]